MTPVLFVAVALAGGLGATARLVQDGIVRSRTSGTAPWGTISINLIGSLLLGLVTGAASATLLPESWHLLLGTGFLGGYTTFSTASFETVRMLQDRRTAAAIWNGLGVLVATTALAALGIWLGGLLAP